MKAKAKSVVPPKKFSKAELLKMLEDMTSSSDEESSAADAAPVVAMTTASVRAKARAEAKELQAKVAKELTAKSAKSDEAVVVLDKYKLDAPTAKFAGSVDEHESWARGARAWHADAVEKNSTGRIGRKLVECLTGKARTAVYASIKEGSGSFDTVMAVLQARFGQRAMSRTMEVARALGACHRGKQTLRDFLNAYLELRSKAEQLGEQFCSLTSGTRLLDAAELAPSTQAQLLQTLALQPGQGGHAMPKFDEVLTQLETLAGVYENQDNKKKVTKETPAFVAETGSGGGRPWAGRPKGGGKGGDGGGAGVQKDIRKPWSGKPGGGGGGGKGNGKGKGKGNGKGKGKSGNGSAKPVCNFFRDGKECPFESKPGGCRFAHEKSKPEPSGAQGAP